MEILQEEREQRKVNLQDRIRQNRASIAKAQFDLISNIDAMRETMPDEDLKVFLAVECGIPKADIVPILAFRAVLGEHEGILRDRSVPFAVVRALIATDSETRGMALEGLAAGDDVDGRRIATIRRSLTRRKLGPHAIAERARKNALVKAAAAHACTTVDSIAQSVSGLLAEIDEFVEEFIPDPNDEDYLMPLTSDRFLAAKKSIEDRAATVQSEFRASYGHVKPVPGTFTTWRTGSHAQRLAAAAGALDLFARGKFAWDGGFSFKNGYLFSTEIQDAMAYLLPCEISPEPVEYPVQKPAKPLRFLEMCAGAGGQAIGLMQAGFAPAGLIELDINACRTLRKNWTWPVVRKNLERLSSDELRKRYHGIDLLSGGVECRPFSRAGKQRGQADHRNLFDQAVRYVKAIEPRAFFFENVVGFTDDKFSAYRASVYRQFEDAGYHVSKLFTMVGTDFGLAQKRERVILMGVRKSEGDRIHAPIPTERDITMGRALKTVLFPYMDQGNAAYDMWATRWLAKYGSRSSHTVLAKLYDPSERFARNWERIGFRIDQNHIADGPIEPGNQDFEGLLPYLTIEVIQVLQGFPSAWRFVGKEPELKFEQIGNAFPPSMAKAVGLSIAQALAGDAWRADRGPRSLFDEERIGKPPVRSGPRLVLNGPDPDFFQMIENNTRRALEQYKREKNDAKIAEFKQLLKEAKADTRAEVKRRMAFLRLRPWMRQEPYIKTTATTPADLVTDA